MPPAAHSVLSAGTTVPESAGHISHSVEGF